MNDLYLPMLNLFLDFSLNFFMLSFFLQLGSHEDSRETGRRQRYRPFQGLSNSEIISWKDLVVFKFFCIYAPY